MGRYHAAVVIGIRFAYGLRIAGQVLLGTSEIQAHKFTILTALGAVIWACLIGGLGGAFGQAAKVLLGELRNVEGWLLLGVAAVGDVVWWIRRSG
jgi:membrane protein DedA with SNARE-associated domain